MSFHSWSLKTFLVVSVFFIFSTKSFAEPHPPVTADEDEELEHLLSLDLENLKVFAASKREEKLTQAPGIITVITQDQIRKFGALSLRDILNRQTSIQITGNHFQQRARTSLRGVGNEHHDRKVLLLLNGRPMREAGTTGINIDIYAGFPVNAIERIEIIRGPGSVLYGTNAVSGVINIVTKSPDEESEFSGAVTYGSYHRRQLTLNGGGKIGELEMYGSANLLNSGNVKVKGIRDQTLTTGDWPMGEETFQGVLTAKWKNLKLNAYANRHVFSSLPLAAVTFPPQDNITERYFFDVGYTHFFNSKWQASINTLYHQHKIERYLLFNTVPYNQVARNLLTELSVRGQIMKNLDVLFGGFYDHQNGDLEIEPGALTDFWDITNHNLYGQLEYQVAEWVRFIGGLQWNQRKDGPSRISPRADLIFFIDKFWHAKLSYGEAFRSPVAEEFQRVVPPLGNPNLSPETIKTLAAQISFNHVKGNVALTFYYSWQKNIIGGTAVYNNSGNIRYHGVELEGKYLVTPRLTLIGNATYQNNRDQTGNYQTTLAPSWMVKTGATYSFPIGIILSVFNNYFGAPPRNNEFVAGVINANPPPDSYSLLTANVIFELGKLTHQSCLDGVSLSIYGDNLLDEDVFFPNINPQTFNSIPFHQGRGVFATLRFETN